MLRGARDAPSSCSARHWASARHGLRGAGYAQARPDLELLREGLRPLVFEGVRRAADADMRTLLANLQVQPARCPGAASWTGFSAMSALAWLSRARQRSCGHRVGPPASAWCHTLLCEQ